MATKSNKSSGTQHNSRGVTQGNTLVGPRSGLPIDEVVDNNGTRRLAVDANFVAQNVQATVDLDVAEDGVHIGDPDTGFTLQVEADGSINANVELDAADGDNVAIQDAQGDQLAINPDGSINVVVNPAVNFNIANVTATLANTEYSYSFPTGTKKFKIKARGNAKLQIAKTSGQTNTTFVTVSPGAIFEEQDINITTFTIYFASSKSGEIVEIWSWN